MNLEELVSNYEKSGLIRLDAVAKVCGEIVLQRIAKSSYSRNVTVKGGFVIMSISNDNRRTTRDLDLDFIKYSLEEKSIISFIEKLGIANSDIFFKVESIKKLKHQDYNGKQVVIKISDNHNNVYDFKLDIGVHKNLELEQEEYYFDISVLDEKVSLLINSKEQIFSEKLKSLLIMGIRTTRYKDLFDFYYLININKIDTEKFRSFVFDYILKSDMREKSFYDIYNRLKLVLTNRAFLANLKKSKDNWLGISIDEVVSSILNFFKSLEKIED